MKKKTQALALAAAVTASAGAYADCGEVSVGSMGWASGEAISALTKFVLEQGYLHRDPVPTDTVPAVAA